MFKMRLYFEDNNSFRDGVKEFQYLDSLAKTLMWLYSNEADGPRDQYYCLKGVIKMYQLINVTTLLVSHAAGELGEASVLDFISDMKKGVGTEWRDSQHNVISEFTNKEGERELSVKWATYELIMSILWSGYIYCKATTSLGDDRWKNSLEVMYKVLRSESLLTDAAFNRNWLIKHTDEMVNCMLGDIEERKKNEGEEKVPSSSVVGIDQLKETLKTMDLIITELKKENEGLKKQIKELEEYKQMLDTPLDGIEADSKVGLTLIMKLMKNDGADFEKSKNKTIAAKALKMMTGRSESACKQIFSVPLSPTYSGHKKKITELNSYLETLGMKTRL